MTENSILISIVIPVFNAQATLEKCVLSVLHQEASRNCEVILVNDGSTDSSRNVMESLALRYPGQIKTISKENKGPGDTRNVGIRNAKGKYIAFLDSDDSVEPNYLSELYSSIERHQPDMILIDYNRIYSRKKNIFEKLYRFKRIKRNDECFTVAEYPDIIAEAEVASWLRIIKRELFDRNAELYFSQEIKLAEDLEASLKWYLYCDRIYILNKKVYNYIIRPASLNFSTHSVLHFITVLDNVCHFYVANGKYDLYKRQLEFICTKHILLSNLLRLRTAKQKGGGHMFKKLRDKMMSYFPDYIHNDYLNSEPFYVRITLFIAFRMPRIFYVILK